MVKTEYQFFLNYVNMHLMLGEIFFRRVPEGINLIHYGIAMTKGTEMKSCIDIW